MLRDLLLLPNLITLSRILLSPLLILVFDSFGWLMAIILYTILSDFADGFIARRMGLRTKLGAVLDPIADKILVMCFLIAAIVHNVLSPWMLLALVVRDIYTITVYTIYLLIFPKGQQIRIESRMGGKVTTFLQFVCLALLSLLPLSAWKTEQVFLWQNLPFALLYPVSLWAILDYTQHYWVLFQQAKKDATEAPLSEVTDDL